MRKTSRCTIPLSEEEHREWLALALEEGDDYVANWVRRLVRGYVRGRAEQRARAAQVPTIAVK